MNEKYKSFSQKGADVAYTFLKRLLIMMDGWMDGWIDEGWID